MIRTFLALALIASSASGLAAEVSATLNCKIKWGQELPVVDLNSNDSCAENCKVQGVGPEGLSFAGETSSASRLKLTISSLTKNETLIFVKDFEFSQIVGTCGNADLSKDGATGTCTVCVKQ